MSIDRLLSELEKLPYDARVRRMVDLGAQARQDTAVRATLTTLAHGDMYQRVLALQACFGSRDGEAVLRALTDPSRTVRQMALNMVASLCDDDQAAGTFDLVPPSRRAALLGMLRKQRRQAVIDTLLEKLLTREPADWLPLISFGSEALVGRLLDTILMQSDYPTARRIARRHPGLLADTLIRMGERATQMDQRLLWIVNAVLPVLSDHVPDQALAMVKVLSRHLPIGHLQLQDLANRRPDELSEFLLTLTERARVDFSHRAAALSEARIASLLEANYLNGHAFAHWGASLDPVVRASLFRRFGLGWRDANGAIPVDALELLPRDLRESEGRRHLLLPALVTEPKQRLPYAALLPWPEALKELTPYLRNADAELRATAWRPLIAAVKFQRERLPELLAMLIARRNEQDPVRSAFLNALALLPPGVWRAEHLEALGQIFRDALNASDFSVESGRVIEMLVVRLLPLHPEWAAAWMATLVKERGQIHLYGLTTMLAPRDIERIAPVLMPVLQAWAALERELQIYGLASALGKRLPAFTGLMDVLQEVIRKTAENGMARRLLSLIARYDHTTFAAMAIDLLQQDASWITVPDIHQYLHRHAQHLLTPYLGQTAFDGRFGTGRTRYILPIDRGFYRWTPTQQAIFAGVLSQVTAENDRDVPALLTVIRQLVGLMMVPPTRLIELASNERMAVRDTAVRALGRLDAGEGIPVLLDAMGDDRGRIAIYALRRSLLEMTPDRALATLRTVPMERVTVAKEVVRLIGDLRTPDAYAELLTTAERDLHYDVRVALVRALWNYLEDARTWAIFDTLIEDANPSVLAIIARTPDDTLSPDSQGRLIVLLGRMLQHADPAVRINVLRRMADLPVTDPQQRLLEPLYAAVQSPLPQEVETASTAIFATYASRQSESIRELLTRLLPNRRALLIFLNALNTAVRARSLYLIDTTTAAVEVLDRDPLLTGYQVRTALSGLAWDQAAALLIRVAESGRLHAGVLAEILAQVAWTIWQTDDMERFEAALRTQPNAMLRRTGLAAMQAYTGVGRRGWTEAALAQLDIYRADPDPLVASAAQFTFPPEPTI
ncbi:MAG: hypothetical protein U0670_14250 [Anaerolineae bacterium]